LPKNLKTVKSKSTYSHKVQKVDKIQLFKNYHNYFLLTQSKSHSDPKVLNRFTVRIQYKSNKIRYIPDPV